MAAHFQLIQLEEGQLGALFTTVDVLRTLNAAQVQREGRRVRSLVSWRITDVQDRTSALDDAAHLTAEERRAAAAAQGEQVLIVPPLVVSNQPTLRRNLARNRALLPRLQRASNAGAWVGTASTGVLLLAQAGLMDGLSAPLPWAFQSSFAADFPNVDLVSDLPLISAGRIACACSVSWQIELVLHLLAMLGHADLATACGHVLQYDSERQRLVAHLTDSGTIKTARDSAVLQAATWIERHADQDIGIDEVARRVAVSRRTLLRHFQQAYGVAPLAFLRRVRIGRAQMMLEASQASVADISERCGYLDAGTFRRAFQQETGMSPQRWRERFRLRPPRTRWRADEVETTR